ncbi:hypothetical protein BN2476_20038 [Paraburkholderia piptadeniae]|uniref:Uncharacterized protein n=1 Tax=Paraburkholderia piptadeniae TaxID=1701573 RepID=A0A1N7RJ35_9BURK|nr:hypothetical protein BN2476_20038 [Paraburkholderia piptadeniae]
MRGAGVLGLPQPPFPRRWRTKIDSNVQARQLNSRFPVKARENPVVRIRVRPSLFSEQRVIFSR